MVRTVRNGLNDHQCICRHHMCTGMDAHVLQLSVARRLRTARRSSLTENDPLVPAPRWSACTSLLPFFLLPSTPQTSWPGRLLTSVRRPTLCLVWHALPGCSRGSYGSRAHSSRAELHKETKSARKRAAHEWGRFHPLDRLSAVLLCPSREANLSRQEPRQVISRIALPEP